MADQVNPTGGVGSGPPLAFMAVARPQPAQEGSRPAKVADSRPKVPGDRRGDLSTPTLVSAAKEIEKHVRKVSSELKFEVDDRSGKTYFKIINPATGEVLLQVPSEEIMAVARKLRQLSNPKGTPGVLVDKEG